MNILKSLVRIANELDSAGFVKEANKIDQVISKLAGMGSSGLSDNMKQKLVELESKYGIVGVGTSKGSDKNLAKTAATDNAILDCKNKYSKQNKKPAGAIERVSLYFEPDLAIAFAAVR